MHWTWPSLSSHSVTPSTTSQWPTLSSTIHWTWPSLSSHAVTPSTTRPTISWSWPPLSSQGTLPSTTVTNRPSLGLTTWSSEFFEYQIGDEVMYDGVKYRCVAPHRSYPGAEPGVFTWAWWERIEDVAENF